MIFFFFVENEFSFEENEILIVQLIEDSLDCSLMKIEYGIYWELLWLNIVIDDKFHLDNQRQLTILHR